jgi:hypothetical protein
MIDLIDRFQERGQRFADRFASGAPTPQSGSLVFANLSFLLGVLRAVTLAPRRRLGKAITLQLASGFVRVFC